MQPATPPAFDAVPPEDLQVAYAALQQRYRELQQMYQEAVVHKQQADLSTRRAEFLREQLEKEREELIIEKIDIRTTLEEYKALQEELIEQHEHLASVHSELRTKNEELHVRGIELRTALEELRATQEELVRNDKLSSLGRVITQIAHEINTPIGAIYAASQNVNNSLPALLASFPTLFKEMPESLRLPFFGVIETAKNRDNATVPADERSLRRDIEALMVEIQVRNPEGVARLLVKAGLYEGFEEYLPLLMDPMCEQLLESAVAIGRLRANIELIASAVGKTQKAVLSLKSYTDDDATPQRGGTVQLPTQLDEVLAQHRHYEKHGVRFDTSYEPTLPSLVCFPEQLQQVWAHLVDNAAKAVVETPGGGVVRVEVAREEGQPNLVVRIGNNGPEIPPRMLYRIFDAFYSTRPDGEGAGLGLFVSKKIIERHKGQIEVKSGPGQTVFTVYLPLTAVSRKVI